MELVREQRDSGLTIRAWCAANSIKEGNFYYWLRGIREAALRAQERRDPAEEQALVQINLPDSVNPGMCNGTVSAIRVQYKDAMLDIPAGTRIEDLSIVLKAINEV